MSSRDINDLILSQAAGQTARRIAWRVASISGQSLNVNGGVGRHQENERNLQPCGQSHLNLSNFASSAWFSGLGHSAERHPPRLPPRS